MLRIYTAAHCPSHDRTHYLVDKLRRQRPHLAIEVIDLDGPNAEQPTFVIGTPTFTWDNRIIFWGNPAGDELLAQLDKELA